MNSFGHDLAQKLEGWGRRLEACGGVAPDDIVAEMRAFLATAPAPTPLREVALPEAQLARLERAICRAGALAGVLAGRLEAETSEPSAAAACRLGDEVAK